MFIYCSGLSLELALTCSQFLRKLFASCSQVCEEGIVFSRSSYEQFANKDALEYSVNGGLYKIIKSENYRHPPFINSSFHSAYNCPPENDTSQSSLPAL